MIAPYQMLEPLLHPNTAPAPVQICLLGRFQLNKRGQPIAVQSGSKIEALLSYLGLRAGQCIPRETLLQILWPSSDVTLAGQSLRSLLYSLQRLLADAIGGAPLIVHSDGCYRLNVEAGVTVDATQFDSLVHRADQLHQAGDPAAEEPYRQAIALYRGDLHVGDADLQGVMAREHLRAHYLALLMRLAGYRFDHAEYHACVELLNHLLSLDPCYEHAHRLLMRCYVRLGNRSIALRHYHVCTEILQNEFNAAPEPDTTALFDQIRLDAGSV